MKAALETTLKEGYSALNTNRIAEKAGVNISSLYHFFPNKHAIVLSIYEQAASELAAMIHDVMLKEMNAPLDKGLARIIRSILDFVDAREAVFIRLMNEVPELRQTSAQMSVDHMAAQVSYMYLKHHLPTQSESTIRYKMFFCQHICMALIYQFLGNRPAGISKARFVNETNRILVEILVRNERIR